MAFTQKFYFLQICFIYNSLKTVLYHKKKDHQPEIANSVTAFEFKKRSSVKSYELDRGSSVK